jgi:hypothetical protein
MPRTMRSPLSVPENPVRPMTNPAVIAPTRWLVYRQIPGLDLFVFADVDIAVHEDAIYSAIRASTTWGEFRRHLPAGEWARLREELFLAEDEVEDEHRSRWEDDNAPLLSEHLPGYDDGEYPPVRSEWLGSVEDFPNVLIKAHHETLAASPYRSVNWQIPEACAASVAATLREWGYLVEQADFLEFC